MGIGTLLKTLAGERGIEIDEEELQSLGLSADDDDMDPSVTQLDEVLSDPIPGSAAGLAEVFISGDVLSLAAGPAQTDGLMWYPIIREGQWAVRPGQTGTKKRVPLKVVSGHSKNQRKQIGLQDLVDAFEDEAIQHVTVPTSHSNTVLENTGFIKAMKIVKGTVKDKLSKKEKAVSVLMGGYDIKLPDVKQKMTLGTIANRSAGILYDYVNTETGKTYPAVIEHVALTNKPWITGMVSFGRKLKEGTADPATPSVVSLSLSNDDPFVSDDEYALALADEAALDDAERDFLAQVESEDWSKEGSPNWLRQQVQNELDQARHAKRDAMRVDSGQMESYPDCGPYYRCVEAKPGKALIADGYGDDSNFWAAPISVKDGVVELGEFDQWSALKKTYVPDERPAPPADHLPLDEEGDQGQAAKSPPKSRLELAQEARRRRAGTPGPANSNANNPREVVDHMAGENGSLQLSEEALRIISEAEKRAADAEQRADQLSEKVERLTSSVVRGDVSTYLNELKADPENGGLGLSEERGFGGVLQVIEELMLADDGEPAVQSDMFSAEGNTGGQLTLSDAIKRIFDAFGKVQEGKKALGEQLSEPADLEAQNGKGGEPGTNAGEQSKGEPVAAGKPGAGGKDGDELSTEDKVAGIAEGNPELAAIMGRTTTAPAAK